MKAGFDLDDAEQKADWYDAPIRGVDLEMGRLSSNSAASASTRGRWSC